MNICPPVRLPLRKDLLSQQQGRVLHLNLHTLHLHAWKLSGDSREFSTPPQEVRNVILAARHPSTKTVYVCRWDKFVAWCADKIDPLTAPLSEVLLFILSLARHGLALGTVKGYLSAISAFLQLPDQHSPVVTRFLKGLQHMFPPDPFVVPQWGINYVLTMLRGSPCKHMHSCTLQHLTI